MGESMALGRRQWLLGTAALLAGGAVSAQDKPALQRIRERGRLVVGIYKNMPPFNQDGHGIDVDLAGALAKAMDLQLSLLPFDADEDMSDDLRNMVWRGHYLGYGPADVLVHVPVDKPLMDRERKVSIFAPYYHERLMIARDLSKVPRMNSMEDFKGQVIAVPGQSLAGWLLIGSEDGRYREQLRTKWPDATVAAKALQNGEVAAAAGHASELESVLAGDPRFAIEPLPLPQMRNGWAVGLAVKREASDLAAALQEAMNGLSRSGEIKRIFSAYHVSWYQP
ncbi:MAG: transporter substrate-binding domain-containing protein [Burkholderiales bacterium]|nr:transporter substrate-binding domain-containing protein [Burkholderiales bacterium]